ncbi:chromate transporter [Pseudarthrobacter phenanthrenivorans]|uniref:chromate transporter n=1 Tax=Pseudarthrobacter phenanthrenivorans TaxID=361575 RepID=UPI002F352DF9
MSDSTNGAGAGDTPAATHEDVPFRKFRLYFLRNRLPPTRLLGRPRRRRRVHRPRPPHGHCRRTGGGARDRGATALLPLGLFFLQTGALVFGSGLAIVALLREGVVDQHHWLNQAQFLDAVAMGLTTPGPVVIAAGILGFILHLPH